MRKIALVVVLVAVFVPAAGAQEWPEGRFTCKHWSRMTEMEKVFFVAGYMGGVESAAIISRDPFIVEALWPTGHRVGSVVIEIDVACKEDRFATAYLEVVIGAIAAKKNVR